MADEPWWLCASANCAHCTNSKEHPTVFRILIPTWNLSSNSPCNHQSIYQCFIAFASTSRSSNICFLPAVCYSDPVTIECLEGKAIIGPNTRSWPSLNAFAIDWDFLVNCWVAWTWRTRNVVLEQKTSNAVGMKWCLNEVGRKGRESSASKSPVFSISLVSLIVHPRTKMERGRLSWLKLLSELLQRTERQQQRTWSWPVCTLWWDKGSELTLLQS